MAGSVWILAGILTILSVTLPRFIPSACFDAFVADADERMAEAGGEPGVLGILALTVLVVALTLVLVL